MKRGSSLRFIEWPMPLTSAVVFRSMVSFLGQPFGRQLNGFDDVDVARTPTEVARDGLADFELGGLLVSCEQRAAGHHHSRSAIAALQSVLFPEAFLDGVKLPVFLQALDSGQLVP